MILEPVVVFHGFGYHHHLVDLLFRHYLASNTLFLKGEAFIFYSSPSYEHTLLKAKLAFGETGNLSQVSMKLNYPLKIEGN